MSKVHHLNIWPEYYREVVSGNKRFEVRKDDRDYQVGDLLVLHEFDLVKQEYTGEKWCFTVAYVLRDKPPFTPVGYVIMSLDNEQDELRQELGLKQGTLDEIYAETERLWKWARETLTGEVADQFWQIAANGSLMHENPEYHQRINMLKHKNKDLLAERDRLKKQYNKAIMERYEETKKAARFQSEKQDLEVERDQLRASLELTHGALQETITILINLRDWVKPELVNEILISLYPDPYGAIKDAESVLADPTATAEAERVRAMKRVVGYCKTISAAMANGGITANDETTLEALVNMVRSLAILDAGRVG